MPPVKESEKAAKSDILNSRKEQTVNQHVLELEGFVLKVIESILLAKIGMIKPIWCRQLPSEPSSVTVIKDCANRYFLSFVVEIEPIQTKAENSSIGIDLGIKTFAVTSNGKKAESPSYKELDRKIRKLL